MAKPSTFNPNTGQYTRNASKRDIVSFPRKAKFLKVSLFKELLKG